MILDGLIPDDYASAFRGFDVDQHDAIPTGAPFTELIDSDASQPDSEDLASVNDPRGILPVLPDSDDLYNQLWETEVGVLGCLPCQAAKAEEFAAEASTPLHKPFSWSGK